MGNVKEYFISELCKIPTNDSKFENSNGKIHSDSEYARAGQHVTGIRVRIGDGLVNSIQFIYDYDPGKSHCHGSQEGRLIEAEFEPDEYIKELSWVSGFNTYYCYKTNSAFTWNIEVVTNYRCYSFGEDPTTYYCGDKKRYRIKVDDGHRIVGIRCKARCSDEEGLPEDCPGSCGKIANTLYAISHVYECEIQPLANSDDTYYNDYYDVLHAQSMTEIRGAIFKNAINRLQFIYSDETLTSMHGTSLPGEEPFSIKLDPKKPLKKLKYHTAESTEPQYGGRPFLTYLLITTDQEYHIGTSDASKLPRSFYHKHTYSVSAGENQELWAFSGLYSKYVGLFLSYYCREIPKRKLLSKTPENTTENEALVFNINLNYNDGKDVNLAAKILIQNWNGWYNASSKLWKDMYGKTAVKKLKKCDFFPAKSDIQEMNCKVTEEMVKKIILSRQYKYITFHCHGSNTYVGNLRQLIDTKWVLTQEKDVFKDVVFHFNCCECGYRLIDDYTQTEGLARALISMGAKATFGYTVALEICKSNQYLSYNVSGSSAEETRGLLFRNLCLRFIGAVDKAYLEETDYSNDIAQKALKEFETIYNSVKKIFNLDSKFIEECIKEYCKERDQKNFVETTNTYCLGTDSRMNKILAKADKLLEKKSEQEKKLGVLAYSLYFKVYFAREHFVGPGEKRATQARKKKNLGEACLDYGNDGGGSSEL